VVELKKKLSPVEEQQKMLTRRENSSTALTESTTSRSVGNDDQSNMPTRPVLPPIGMIIPVAASVDL